MRYSLRRVETDEAKIIRSSAEAWKSRSSFFQSRSGPVRAGPGMRIYASQRLPVPVRVRVTLKWVEHC